MKEKDPPVTHGVHPKRTGPPSVDIYVPPKDRSWVKEMQEALKRDGSSLSAWTLQEMRQWWDKHRPGNPQTGLERFGEVVEIPAGPGVPGSFLWRDGEGLEHWCYWQDLPHGWVIHIRKDGTREALRSFLD